MSVGMFCHRRAHLLVRALDEDEELRAHAVGQDLVPPLHAVPG